MVLDVHGTVSASNSAKSFHACLLVTPTHRGSAVCGTDQKGQSSPFSLLFMVRAFDSAMSNCFIVCIVSWCLMELILVLAKSNLYMSCGLFFAMRLVHHEQVCSVTNFQIENLICLLSFHIEHSDDPIVNCKLQHALWTTYLWYTRPWLLWWVGCHLWETPCVYDTSFGW